MRVKICGVTRYEDAALALELGADAIGFIFWPNSPRVVTPAAVRAIVRRLPAFVTRVGVFVNEPPADVAAVVSGAELDVAQLHGDEVVDRYADVPARLIKGVALSDDEAVARALAWPVHVTPLVDAADRVKRGGTGQRADWTRAAALAARRPVLLAGGLTPENVAEAVHQVRPWAIDVSSGVETAPGVKSADRLRRLFEVIARLRAEGL